MQQQSAPGTVGRYVILYALHHSAAADLYVAYDPELDRKVMIKQLSAEQRGGPVQELAQRAHPHLVTVHDVGICEQRVFIAMEFVGSAPLSAWLLQGPHTYEEILRRFVDAGAGLVAAHAQGLAHRGFTADEVLLDAEGRARVQGFYRPRDQAALAAARREDLQAFKTALRRALAPAPAPVGSDLEGLLRALHRRAQRPLRVAVGVLCMGAVLAGSVYYQRQATLCRGADTQIAQLFEKDRAQTIHRAFLQTGKSYAEDAFAGVQRALAAYSPRWAALHQKACEDTRQRRQPEAVRDLRMACLEQQRARLDQLFTVFTTADAQVVQRAVALVHEFTDPARIEGCLDVAALRAQAPPPADRATASVVATMRQDLLRSRALERAGRFQEGIGIATQAEASATGLNYLPILAEALYQEGRFREWQGAYAAADQLFLRALWAAEASHHDRLAAEIWLQRFEVASDRLQHIREGHEYARHTAAAIERCAGCADLWELWHDNMGRLLYAEARPREALPHTQQALRQRLLRLPPMSTELVEGYNDLANLYWALEQPTTAQELQQKALLISERELGPHHPTLAAGLHNLAAHQRDLGQLEEALRTSMRSQQIFEQSVGKTSLFVGHTLRVTGTILLRMERYEQAQEHLRQALVIEHKELGREHPRVAYTLISLGEAALHLGHAEQARAHFAEALAIGEKTLPPQHADLAFLLVGLGRALIALSQPEQALPLLQRALRICAANAPLTEGLAGARFALALTRGPSAAARREAYELAEQARLAYLGLGEGFRWQRSEVEKWQREHPLPR